MSHTSDEIVAIGTDHAAEIVKTAATRTIAATMDPDNHRQRTRGAVVGSVDIQEETILARTLGRLGDSCTRCVRVLRTDRTIISSAGNGTVVHGGSLRSLPAE